MTYFDFQEQKRIIMLMLESKFDIRMFCVHIFYKLFQLLMRIKSDKNIINIPPINVRTKTLWAIRWKWNNYFELFDIDCRYHFFVKSFNHYGLLVNRFT